MGKYGKQNFFIEENLRNISDLLQSVKIFNNDFEEIEEYVTKRSFFYIDPPYRVKSNNGFLLYNEKIFSWKDQVRLAYMVRRLAKNSAKVMISNADNDDVIKLYENFHRNYSNRPNIIGGRISSRGSVKEIILTSYKTPQWNLYSG